MRITVRLLLQGNLTAVCSNEENVFETIWVGQKVDLKAIPTPPPLYLSGSLLMLCFSEKPCSLTSAVILFLSEVSQVSVKKAMSHP